MTTTRLVLVEGMIGAGKTTTAAHIAHWLAGRGEDARAYHEFDDDHPIRTKAVDLLRAAHPEGASRAADTGEDGMARDPAVYAPSQWRTLAARCAHGQQTIIMESTLLQNSVLPCFANGAPIEKVKQVFAEIEAQLTPASPLLIYLRPSDVERAVERAHSERGEPWASWNSSSVASYPWARSRNLHGRRAVVELYRAWEHVVDELWEMYSFPKLLVVDPQDDWNAALCRIYSEVRP